MVDHSTCPLVLCRISLIPPDYLHTPCNAVDIHTAKWGLCYTSPYYQSLTVKTGLTVNINMQNDEKTDEIEVEQQDNQTVEVETPSTEETPTEPQSGEEVNLEAELAHAKSEAAKFRRLFEKTQKPKPQSQAVAEAPQKTPSSSVEETVLLAQGMSEDLLSELKAVAKVRNVSLIKAQADPIFTMIKEKFEKDAKQKDASLPASRGAGASKPKKDFSTPNLSKEEHKKMVLDAMRS